MIELLERVVSGGGVLLKADAVGVGDGGEAQLLQLTFDVGRIGVSVDLTSSAAALSVRQLEAEEPGGVSQAEEEPWWRLLGCPLCGASQSAQRASEVRLQFRPDDQSPRFVRLRAAGDRVRAILEPVARSELEPGGTDV